jgi:hypothetical protein
MAVMSLCVHQIQSRSAAEEGQFVVGRVWNITADPTTNGQLFPSFPVIAFRPPIRYVRVRW